MPQGRDLAPFFGDLNQSEKFSEIKPPLNSFQGRLEQFLENVTAAEMLHHLFPPLAFLVDECFDYFDEDLGLDHLIFFRRTLIRS